MIVAGDTLIVSGLRLVSPDTQPLELDFNGDDARDVYAQYALRARALWPGGAYDGRDRYAMAESAGLTPAAKGTLISILSPMRLPAGWRIQTQRRNRRSAVATKGRTGPLKTAMMRAISWGYGSNERQSSRPSFRHRLFQACLVHEVQVFLLTKNLADLFYFGVRCARYR